MKEQFSAIAKVTLTIEVTANSSWGTNTTMDQVYKQAAEDAIGKVQHMIQETKTHPGQFRIIGTPKIDAVIARREVP